jgi:hypothetical protein
MKSDDLQLHWLLELTIKMHSNIVRYQISRKTEQETLHLMISVY